MGAEGRDFMKYEGCYIRNRVYPIGDIILQVAKEQELTPSSARRMAIAGIREFSGRKFKTKREYADALCAWFEINEGKYARTKEYKRRMKEDERRWSKWALRGNRL